MLREGLKLARTLGGTPPLSSAMQAELVPGPTVQTDDDWDAWIKDNVYTEYHPSSTCAMMPKSKGGVVDARLRVYGTANVRVVDAAVFPTQLSAHLSASVYGVAEKGAAMILEELAAALG